MKEQIFRVTYTDVCGNTDVEGYYTMSEFDQYLAERNEEREADGELLESKDEFEFEGTGEYKEVEEDDRSYMCNRCGGGFKYEEMVFGDDEDLCTSCG